RREDSPQSFAAGRVVLKCVFSSRVKAHSPGDPLSPSSKGDKASFSKRSRTRRTHTHTHNTHHTPPDHTTPHTHTQTHTQTQTHRDINLHQQLISNNTYNNARYFIKKKVCIYPW